MAAKSRHVELTGGKDSVTAEWDNGSLQVVEDGSLTPPAAYVLDYSHLLDRIDEKTGYDVPDEYGGQGKEALDQEGWLKDSDEPVEDLPVGAIATGLEEYYNEIRDA